MWFNDYKIYLLIHNIIMKKVFLIIAVLFNISTVISAQNWNNNNNDDYCYGGGMMWNNGDNDYCYGPNMMGSGYWMDNGWHRYGQNSLNLTEQQQEKWNNLANNGRINQQAANDSINYYVAQIKRLQKTKSTMIQSDLNQIKSVLTPAQYTQFLEKLVTGNPQ